MTNTKLSNAIKAGIQNYVGMSCTMELQEDPGVENTFAARCTFSNGETHDFLIVGGEAKLARLTPVQMADLVEDVEFERLITAQRAKV